MTQPYIYKETYNSQKAISLETELYMDRNIFLFGEINSELADSILMQLMSLTKVSDEPINLYIDSPGGEITAGMMIYDLLTNCKVPITYYGVGMVASMAAIIFSGGKKGRRILLPHTKVMIHEPQLHSKISGSATSITNISDSINKTKEMLNEILAINTEKDIEEIKKATAYDNYMSAEEAVEFGLGDKIKSNIL